MTPNEAKLIEAAISGDLDYETKAELVRAILLERLTPECLEAVQEHVNRDKEHRALSQRNWAALADRYGMAAIETAKQKLRDEKDSQSRIG